jgi:predicted metal-binding membrane protein
MANWEASMAAMGMKDIQMEGGPMAPSSAPAAYLLEAFVMWLIMMVAMMLPSAAPMILLYGKVTRRARQQGGVFASTTVFASFYLLVWGGFSAIAALIQWTLVRSGAISDMGLAFGDGRVAGALLIATGLYQLTPLKYACLEKCRSPLSFLVRLWRGAAQLGMKHDVYCWVAGLAIVVLVEKVVPRESDLAGSLVSLPLPSVLLRILNLLER